MSSDGCSFDCQIEDGFECVGTICSPICGDQFVLLNECEDSNQISGDGCSDTCEVETGFNCTIGYPSICTSKCLDGVQASDEECDDGNLIDDDECNSLCVIP